jgi:hypothetical protein
MVCMYVLCNKFVNLSQWFYVHFRYLVETFKTIVLSGENGLIGLTRVGLLINIKGDFIYKGKATYKQGRLNM